MQRLTKEAALKAVKNPVENIRPFAEGVAEKLVEDLSEIVVHRAGGGQEKQSGQYVEPVQLQVVCYSMWESLPPEGTEISESDLMEVGDVDESLESFYNHRVESIAKEKDISERALREWFEQELITSSKTRNMVLHEAQSSAGLRNDIVRALQGDLVRAELSAGQVWYELSHDRLIEPILKSNATWFAANLNLFQQQAELWNRQGRSEGLLLRRQELCEAETWAEANAQYLTGSEIAFLEACRKARNVTRAQVLANQRLRRSLKTSLIVAGVAIFLLGVSILLGIQSYQNQRSTKMQILVNASTIELNKGDKELATRLAYQALDQYGDYGETEQTLANVVHPLDRQPSSQVPFMIQNQDWGVNSVVFNPNAYGKTLAISSSDNTIFMVDTSTRMRIGQPFRGHTDAVLKTVFSPDGKLLASIGSDRKVILWDVENRTSIGQLVTGYTYPIQSIAFSPDGKLLASAGSDPKITLWDVASRKPSGQPLEGHVDVVWSIAFSPDGKLLASNGPDNTVILWDVASRKPIGQPLKGHTGETWNIAFSPDGKLLASGGRDQTVILWDVASRKLIGQPLKGHTGVIWSIAFSPDGKLLASAGPDQKIILWDMASRQPVGQPLTGHTHAVRDVVFSPDGKLLASVENETSEIILWDVANRQAIGVPFYGMALENITRVDTISFTTDGRIMASEPKTADQPAQRILWDPEIGQRTMEEWDKNENNPVFHLESMAVTYRSPYAISPDGKYKAYGGYTDIWVSEIAPYKEVFRKRQGGSTVTTAVAFSHDSQYVASASKDFIIIWKAKSGKQVGKIRNERHSKVTSLSFGPTGFRLAIAYDDSGNTVEVWDIGSGQKILVITNRQLQNVGYAVINSVNLFDQEEDLQNPSAQVRNKQVGTPVADVYYSQDGLFILYHNGAVDHWDLWPSRAELKKIAEDTCGACELDYAKRLEYKFYTLPMQVTNYAGYLIVILNLVCYGFCLMVIYRTVFARSLSAMRVAGFSWRKFLLASAQGGFLLSLSLAGILTVFLLEILYYYNEMSDLRLSRSSFISALTILPLGLWAGGAYAHFTRSQAGKLSKTRRVILGSLTGMLSGILQTITTFSILIIMAISIEGFQSVRGSSGDIVDSMVVFGRVTVISAGLASLLGALLYIFWLGPWSSRWRERRQVQEETDF